MKREVIIQYIYSIKDRLSGGLLCCCVVLAAYFFQIFFSELYVDAFSSSIYLAGWMTLLVGAMFWTLREEDAHGLPEEIVEWQCVAAFLLTVGEQIYIITPKQIHDDIAPVLSNYTIPVLVIGSLLTTVLIKWAISLHRRLKQERERTALQAHQLQQLLNSPIPEQEGCLLVRKLFENEPIIQLTNKELLMLIEESRKLDPTLFKWLKETDHHFSSRDIIYLILIRLRKSKEEILFILGISNDTYRTMKSRVRKRIDVRTANDLETYLKAIR